MVFSLLDSFVLHNLQRSILKSVQETRIKLKTNNKTKPKLDNKDIQIMNIPPEIFNELYTDLIHKWETKQQQLKTKNKKIIAKDYILNEKVMKETAPTL